MDAIFSTELAIRFQLVDDNDAVVFADPATDPFTGNDDAGTLIDESQAQIDLLIGTENYEHTHESLPMSEKFLLFRTAV